MINSLPLLLIIWAKAGAHEGKKDTEPEIRHFQSSLCISSPAAALITFAPHWTSQRFPWMCASLSPNIRDALPDPPKKKHKFPRLGGQCSGAPPSLDRMPTLQGCPSRVVWRACGFLGHCRALCPSLQPPPRLFCQLSLWMVQNSQKKGSKEIAK